MSHADAMGAKSQAQIPAILRSYDVTRFNRIGDIGGGNGHLLAAVLDRAPAASGVVFDLPHVVDAAPRSSSERIALQAGDFFTDPLPSCDAYLLMHVLHDWNDDRAVDILRAIGRSAPSDAVLLVLESIVRDVWLPPGSGYSICTCWQFTRGASGRLVSTRAF